MKSEILYTVQGNDVYEYTIKNDDLEIRALNFGASITMVKVKNKVGVSENVVMSYDDIEMYFTQPGPYLNAMVGPSAGRIAYGKYQMDGSEHHLSINNGEHHLHGGISGISKQFFRVKELVDGDIQTLRFTLVADHSEDGYNGVYYYSIDYILDKNTFTIQASCVPRERGIVNLTSHMYFNLSGDMKASIEEQELCIPASKKTEIVAIGYPKGIVEIQSDSAFDFRKPKKMIENFRKGSEEFTYTKGYDTAFVLNEGNMISLYDPQSGRKMEVTTNQKSVVVYTANYFDEQLLLNGGKRGYPFCSVALETQDIPNAINILGEENRIYDEEHPYRQITTYKFYCE